MRLESLRELFKARVRLFLREPEAVFWTFGFPVLIAVALGIAFRTRGPEKVHVAVLLEARAGDPAPEGGFDARAPDAVEAALQKDASLDVQSLRGDTAREALRTGEVAVVVIPGNPIGFRYDPTRPESRTARLAVEDALDRSAQRPPAFAAHEEQVTEKGSRYIDFLIPGLIGMNIMSASMWGIGWSIVEARSRKLLKRLAATPMPRANYLLAFLLGHLVLVFALMLFIVVFARVSFGVTVFGSTVSLFAVAMLGAMSFAGLGLLCSSRTDKSEVLSGLNNAVMLPMLVASGVFFSSAHFPEIVQPLIQALPLTALNDAMRAIYIDGKPLLSQLAPMGILAAWGVATFAAALRWFRWT